MSSIFGVLAVCAAIAKGEVISPQDFVSKENCEKATNEYQAALKKTELNTEDRDAIARVTVAEASNQGSGGIAAVVYTIINRYISGQFGDSVSKIVDSHNQFEPVTKAGGWKKLPSATPEQFTQINTIIDLALGGHLPDLTNGALYFQNPQIVQQREQEGEVTKGLTNFGGSTPSAVIKDHAFFAEIGKGEKPVTLTARPAQPASKPKNWDIYAQSETTIAANKTSWDVFTNDSAQKISSSGIVGAE